MKQVPWWSRTVVDPINSVAWFAMDGLWLAQLTWAAYAATALTLATGAVLLIEGRLRGRRPDDDLALNAWMWMNALWVVSDLGGLPSLRLAALVVCVLGALLLANGFRPSKRHRRMLHHFRKLRLTGR